MTNTRKSWDPRRDCSFCGNSPDEYRRVVQGPGVNICADCLDLCRAVLDDGVPPAAVPGLEGIGDDVRLVITCAAGPLLDETLIMRAVRARTAGGVVLPFVYRDPPPLDDDEPAEPRPLRRASLVIIEHGTLPEPETSST